jgi:hypothetical protein
LPSFDWQLIVALLAVAGAGWFLARRALNSIWPAKKDGSACGSCGSCAGGQNATRGSNAAFVPLESLAANEHKE